MTMPASPVGAAVDPGADGDGEVAPLGVHALTTASAINAARRAARVAIVLPLIG
jgi:hypothetical protein